MAGVDKINGINTNWRVIKPREHDQENQRQKRQQENNTEDSVQQSQIDQPAHDDNQSHVDEFV